MKIPPGMSKTVAHRLVIADRSAAGLAKVDEILEIAPFAGERIVPWRNSSDRFIFFVMEEKNGRFGALSAKDLDDLLSKIVELFDTHLLPPANPTFDIVVTAPDNKTIYDHAAKWMLATVVTLEAGVRL